MMVTILLAIQMLSALGMIGLVLVQHGKGADAGAAFGSGGGGSAGSLFGATGSANFLSRSTAVLAAVFFAATLALAYFGNARPTTAGSVLEGPAAAIPQTTAPVDASIPPATAPAADAAVPVAPAADVPAPAAEQPAAK